MDLAELKKKGLVKEIAVDKKQISELIALSKRDLDFSKDSIAKNYDWAFNIAYSSILQMSRAVMNSYGLRADETDMHKTTLIFIVCAMGEKYGELVGSFDRLRRKRHSTVYDEAGKVSEYEAKFAVKSAKEFYDLGVAKIREKIGKV
ncbi:MAG: HEPN domain-containing protein [Candidatus Micrarchaeia archaeon]|jgi:uncharacterized protein (UPF0332 family)